MFVIVFLKVSPKAPWMESPLQSRTIFALKISRLRVPLECLKVGVIRLICLIFTVKICYKYQPFIVFHRLHSTIQCYSGTKTLGPRGGSDGEDKHGWVCYGVKMMSKPKSVHKFTFTNHCKFTCVKSLCSCVIFILFFPVQVVLMGLLVQSRTRGVTLLPTELKQGHRLTLTGSLLEEVQAEVLQLWPHLPATCEETPSLSASLYRK